VVPQFGILHVLLISLVSGGDKVINCGTVLLLCSVYSVPCSKGHWSLDVLQVVGYTRTINSGKFVCIEHRAYSHIEFPFEQFLKILVKLLNIACLLPSQ
jgi:hypothetical protein